MLVFVTNLSLMGFQVKYLPLYNSNRPLRVVVVGKFSGIFS